MLFLLDKRKSLDNVLHTARARKKLARYGAFLGSANNINSTRNEYTLIAESGSPGGGSTAT